jgi:hypothetical protein
MVPNSVCARVQTGWRRLPARAVPVKFRVGALNCMARRPAATARPEAASAASAVSQPPVVPAPAAHTCTLERNPGMPLDLEWATAGAINRAGLLRRCDELVRALLPDPFSISCVFSIGGDLRQLWLGSRGAALSKTMPRRRGY